MRQPEADGPGRPLEIGRPLGHAYILRLVAEFQAFVRDLHDLCAERVVDLTEPAKQFRPVLIAAITVGRAMDRSNADIDTIVRDFRRLGIRDLRTGLAHRDRWWSQASGQGDQASFRHLMDLRNALAHGNQRQLDRLRAQGVADTITWCRKRLSGLNRIAAALDRTVWENLESTFGREPW